MASRAQPLPHRLVCVQFGDLAGALARQRRGEPETYYAQDFTVGFLAGLAGRLRSMVSVTLTFDQAEARQEGGLLTAGVRLYPPGARARHRELGRLVARHRPTHLLLQTPAVPLLRWAIGEHVDVLPLLFDSFNARGLRARLRHRRLARALNHPAVRWVGNHGLGAAQDLARIGVREDKILPVDWPALLNAAALPPWSPSPCDAPFRVVFVGALSEAKGAGDAVRALALLRSEARPFTLTLVGGGGEGEAWLRELAARAGIADRVAFAGKIPHDDVLDAMRAHDAVLVPSRHDYPEGLPMTVYEAFCAKAPLVVSDHPMFRHKVRDQHNALVFPAGDATALAHRLRALATDAQLGARLSEAAAREAEHFFLPLKWHDVIDAWLRGQPADDEFLRRHTLRVQNCEGG